MTEFNKTAITTDAFQIKVLETIASMTETAFGISIHTLVTPKVPEDYIQLADVYEALVDLAYDDRLTIVESIPGSSRSRRIYGIALPEGMVAYSPKHPDYPNAPKDWDKGDVFHMDGSVASTHGETNDLAWTYDAHADGTNIAGYKQDPTLVAKKDEPESKAASDTATE